MKNGKASYIVRLAIFCAALAAAAYFYFHNTVGLSALAEAQLRSRIDTESHGKINLVSFVKTDGQESEAFGVKGYSLSYNAEIECSYTYGGIWLRSDMLNYTHQGLTFSFKEGQPSGNAFQTLNDNMAGATPLKWYQRVKIAGVMNGSKSENGWTFTIGDSHVVSGL